MNRKYMMQASLALAFALAGPQFPAYAEEAVAVPAAAAQPAASAGVVAFGQTLNPQQIQLRGSAYVWSDLQEYLPQLLPDAGTRTMTANQVCDHFKKVNNEYLDAVERSTGDLIYKMEAVVNQGLAEAPADMALTTRLGSPAQADMDTLLRLLPAEREQLLRAREATRKSLAMIILYDAALLNCPDYAREKGYFPIY